MARGWPRKVKHVVEVGDGEAVLSSLAVARLPGCSDESAMGVAAEREDRGEGGEARAADDAEGGDRLHGGEVRSAADCRCGS